jgi:hypothetical protein
MIPSTGQERKKRRRRRSLSKLKVRMMRGDSQFLLLTRTTTSLFLKLDKRRNNLGINKKR